MVDDLKRLFGFALKGLFFAQNLARNAIQIVKKHQTTLMAAHFSEAMPICKAHQLPKALTLICRRNVKICYGIEQHLHNSGPGSFQNLPVFEGAALDV
jgi:hypothetical protein